MIDEAPLADAREVEDVMAPRVSVDGRAHPLDLSASVMCAQLDALGAEIERLESARVDSFHFDVMGGHFVPSLGFSTDDVAALRPRSKLRFHVHVMAEEPQSYVDGMRKAGCALFAFHIEAARYPRRLVDRVHQRV